MGIALGDAVGFGETPTHFNDFASYLSPVLHLRPCGAAPSAERPERSIALLSAATLLFLAASAGLVFWSLPGALVALVVSTAAALVAFADGFGVAFATFSAPDFFFDGAGSATTGPAAGLRRATGGTTASGVALPVTNGNGAANFGDGALDGRFCEFSPA